ncbi:MAG TPA: YaiO family outer membrane beta-barrel protein [Methylibium sp.]
MNKHSRCLALVLALAAAGAAADEKPWQVEAGAGAEYLTSNGQQWTQEDLALRSRFAPHSVAELATRHTRRYGQNDDEFGGSVVLPLGTDWLFGASAATSPTHRLLAKDSGSVDLGRRFSGGWLLTGGLSRSLFEIPTGASGGTTFRLNGERYVGDWRFAAGFSHIRLDGGGAADNGGRIQADHYFAERGRIGAVLAVGRELDIEPDLQGVLSIRVESAALLGVLPLSPDWGLSWSLGSTRNSDAMVRTGPNIGRPVGFTYRRNAVHIGVQHDF